MFSLVLFTFLTFGATRACFGLLCCCFTGFSIGVGLTVNFRHYRFPLLAVLAACLKFLAVGAPLAPLAFIFSLLPALIRFRLAWMFS